MILYLASSIEASGCGEACHQQTSCGGKAAVPFGAAFDRNCTTIASLQRAPTKSAQQLKRRFSVNDIGYRSKTVSSIYIRRFIGKLAFERTFWRRALDNPSDEPTFGRRLTAERPKREPVCRKRLEKNGGFVSDFDLHDRNSRQGATEFAVPDIKMRAGRCCSA